ncbi:tape measure protein [Erwinia sp. V90_4]|uniref:tape measure protein n=1 Tax=Erwinia sp. V90_4 TaxID=3044239 RepID=UPI00249DD059|nr:tape measure protein [Erwinia sp. V90_4]MDI3440337.1 tape measure protein [Erwinia sp. V90_4]
MATVDGGKLQYEIEIETAKLMTGSRKASVVLEQLNKNAQAASGGFDKVDSSGRKASSTLGSVSSGAKNAGDNLSSAGRGAEQLGGGFSRLASLVKGYITVQAALKLIEIADDMTMLQARVTRLSGSMEEAKNTMASLSAIAANTGNSLASTEKLWETLTASLKEAGATNGQVLMLTDTLQKIGVVGGSSAEEMSNALRQFGQSIAGGVVRAEEFNSVLENMPELARQMAAGLGLSLGQLRQRMLEGKLTAEDALNAIQKQAGNVNTEFEKMPVTVDRAKNSLDVAFKNMINDLNQSIGLTQELAGLMQSVANNLNFYNKNVGDSSRMPKLISLQKEYNEELRDGQRWYESDTIFQQRRGEAASKLKQVEGEIAHIRAKAAKDMEDSSKHIAVKGAGTANPKQDDLIKKSQRRIELSKLEGEARARLQAQYDAEDAGIKSTDPRVKSLQDQYAEIYRNTQAQKTNNAEGKKSASQAESIAEKLAALKEQAALSADSTRELSREQAILTAQQSLGSAATQDDIKLAGQYAAAKWDTGNAIRAQAAAEKLLPESRENASYSQDVKDLNTALAAKKISQEQYNATSEQLEQQHQANLAKIRADQAVTPQQAAAGTVDPVQALANENAQKLALIQQFEQQKTITEQQGLALRNAANTQYEEQRIAAQWEIWRQQSAGNDAAAAAFDSFAGNASNALTGIITGSMSAQDAMRSLGSTVLNSLVNSFVQMGVEWVKSAVTGAAAQTTAVATTTAASVAGTATTTAASTAAAATTTAAWTPAAIVASIASFGTAAAIGLGAVLGVLATGIAGKRKNGGPVSAGSMYQVGEGGMPEIYQASSGKQYMIPGDNGSVISNKDMQGGGITIINNIENYSSNATVDTQATSDGNGNVTIQTIVTDIANGGEISQAISNFHSAPRRARG